MIEILLLLIYAFELKHYTIYITLQHLNLKEEIINLFF